MKIKINIKKEGAMLPTRAHYNDVGADVYAQEDCLIEPYSTAKIPLGFGLELPDGYMAIVQSRSGLAGKGIACEMAPVDSGYKGEIHAIVTNHGRQIYRIQKGDRIGQIVIYPIIYADFVADLGEERKDGAFGSTGR